MPRRNSPPTPTTPGNSAPGSDTSEGDFVILPRPSLDTSATGAHQTDLQLQSQLSPTGVSNGGTSTSMVTMMQYDQLVNTARAMKEENNMLKGQLTEMVQTMGAHTKEIVQMKNANQQVTERCKDIRKLANLEVTRLRGQVKTLEEQVLEGAENQDIISELQSQNEELKKTVASLEAKAKKLEMELKNKTEEAGKSDAAVGEATAETPVSLLTQLKRDIEDVQGTRADIQANMANLEEAFQKSAIELKHYKQKVDLLALEKQDLVALNNELQTKVSMYSNGGYQDRSLDQSVSEVGSEREAHQGSADSTESQPELPPTPFSPGQAIKKSNLAIQDILLQLQAERDKVTSLREDLKKEREARNKMETTLMEQLDARSGEHSSVLEELNKRHQAQVEELVIKVDELSVANQEPHHSIELKQQVRSLVSELQERETILEQKEHLVSDLRSTNEALKSKISLYHDELEEVRKQDSQMIETLREELDRQQGHYQKERQKGLIEKINHDKLVDEHQHLRQEFNQLFADYDNMNRSYEELRARNTQAVNANALRELAEQRDNLTAQLMSAEEAIDAKQEQLDKAQRELREAKTKLETIPVLEAQAEIFKNDFDAERAAREKAHAERELLMGQLEDLREENQRMQEELASHTKVQLQQMQNRHGNTGNTGNTGSSSSSSGSGGNVYERYIAPVFGLGSQARRNERGYGHNTEYGNANTEDNYDTIPELSPGADVDQGIYEEPRLPGMQPNLDQGYSQRPIRNNPTCPKCQNEFPEIDTLQIHMLDCIK